MHRVPEDELMNDPDNARAYAETDFSEPHESFVSNFKERFPDFLQGEVLDLGCGPADITLRFARRFSDSRITGIDGAQAMIDIGLNEIKASGLSHRITLKKVLLPAPRLFNHNFDAVISNSLLHHLQNPSVLWQTVKFCVNNDSPVFIMDLLRPDSIEDANKLVHLYVSDAPDLLQKDFFNSLLASYTVKEVEVQLQENGIYWLKTEVISDRHMIIWGRMNS
jgi:cyclopropane fatty-acyl-phospholipid synthase-like methyltransferase